jgi:hypothetical protein
MIFIIFANLTKIITHTKYKFNDLIGSFTIIMLTYVCMDIEFCNTFRPYYSVGQSVSVAVDNFGKTIGIILNKCGKLDIDVK